MMNKLINNQSFAFLLIISMVFVLNLRVYGQEETDSLRSKIEHYIDQAWSLPYTHLDSAMHVARKAWNMTKKDQVDLRFQCLDVIAQIYLDRGQLDSALFYSIDALELAQENEVDSLIAYAYNGLDVVYFEMQEYKKSEDYARKTLEMASELDMESLKSEAYMSLAIANYQSSLDTSMSESEKLEKYNVSKDYFKKALSNPEITIDDSLNIYNNLSVLEAEFENYQTSIEYLEKVVRYYEESGDLALLANAYNNLGYIYFETGRLKEGENYLKKAWNLIEGKQLLIEESYIAESLYELYDSMGNYEKALKFYQKHKETEQKLYSRNTKDNIDLLEQEYKNRILSAENERREQQLQNQYFMIIGGVILLLLLVVILIMNYYSRKKQKRLLGELERSNAQLEELNSFKDNILSIVSHDFRSPLSNLKTAIEVSREEDFSRDDYKSIIQGIDDQLTRTQVFLQNILLWAKKQIKGYNVEKTEFQFNRIVEEAEQLFEQQIEEKNLQIQKSYDQSLQIYSDFEIVNIVFRNIFQNAVKFSRNGEQVVIKIREGSGEKIISVLDSGRGMNKETIDRLFSKNISATGGTQLGSGAGIGLLLSRDLLKLIDADINVYSVVDQGSEFQIILPGA